MSFDSLGLSDHLLRAVQAQGYDAPTAIQQRSIPHITAGADLAAEAQTGSGKTAAFVLPILQKMASHRGELTPIKIGVLTITPTRELALQIAETFKLLGQFADPPPRVVSIIGGLSLGDQISALSSGADIVVATPGRLLDLMEREAIDINHVHTLVLDEADKLLDVGFNDELTVLLNALPTQRQNLLFSATLPQKVLKLSARVLNNPTVLRIDEQRTSVATIEQRAYQVERDDRRLLLQHLLETEHWGQTLVFVATQIGATNLARKLRVDGFLATELHGGLEQPDRIFALTRFRSGRAQIMVATDIAARGIDIPLLGAVVNFDLPRAPADYVHRIGRTGRAGESGVAVTFVDHETEDHLRLIEKKNQLMLTRRQVLGFEISDAPAEKTKGLGPKKGKRKSKKDKLRERQ
ncbi:MAG: DEAD/DEAH box helicase [Myxococcota bacterium]|nr:DEAD/DEAH box helicase [Myxococcota bacterium]